MVDPPDGRIPLSRPAQRRAAGRDQGFGTGPFNGPEDLTNYDRCITRSVGSIFPRPSGNGLRIVQSPGYIAITDDSRYARDCARRPSARRQHIRMYMGDSRSRWENGTLVVETKNLTDRTSIGSNNNKPAPQPGHTWSNASRARTPTRSVVTIDVRPTRGRSRWRWR